LSYELINIQQISDPYERNNKITGKFLCHDCLKEFTVKYDFFVYHPQWRKQICDEVQCPNCPKVVQPEVAEEEFLNDLCFNIVCKMTHEG